MSRRTKVWQADEPEAVMRNGKVIDQAEFLLGVDDDGGCGLQHGHGEAGHEWPMTFEELTALWNQINFALAEYKEGGQP